MTASRPLEPDANAGRLLIEGLAGAVGAVVTMLIMDRLDRRGPVTPPLRFATSFFTFRLGMSGARAVLSRILRAT